MNSDLPKYDPFAVWQSETGDAVPSLREISARARKFEAKNHRHSLLFWIAASLYLAISITEDFAGFKGSIWWIGAIRFGLFVLWVLYIPFRKGAPDGSLQITGTTAVLEEYRRSLVRRRDYFRDSFRTKLRAGLLLVGFVIYSIFYPTVFLIFGLPSAIAGAVAFKRRRNEVWEIDREIEAVDRLQKESQ